MDNVKKVRMNFLTQVLVKEIVIGSLLVGFIAMISQNPAQSINGARILGMIISVALMGYAIKHFQEKLSMHGFSPGDKACEYGIYLIQALIAAPVCLYFYVTSPSHLTKMMALAAGTILLYMAGSYGLCKLEEANWN